MSQKVYHILGLIEIAIYLSSDADVRPQNAETGISRHAERRFSSVFQHPYLAPSSVSSQRTTSSVLISNLFARDTSIRAALSGFPWTSLCGAISSHLAGPHISQPTDSVLFRSGRLMARQRYVRRVRRKWQFGMSRIQACPHEAKKHSKHILAMFEVW